MHVRCLCPSCVPPSKILLPDSKIFPEMEFVSQELPTHITHVIFDLDGTLLDTEVIYKDVYTSMALMFNKEYTQEVRLQHVGTPEMVTAQVVTALLQLPITPEEFLNISAAKLEEQLVDCKTMPGVDRLVRHLHACGVPMAIATSSNMEAVTLKMTKHRELEAMFHHIVCGDDPAVEHGKPSPDIFLVTASRFPDAPDPKKVLVFEDSVAGVNAGLAAGMNVVACPDELVPRHLVAGATEVLDSLELFQPEKFGFAPF